MVFYQPLSTDCAQTYLHIHISAKIHSIDLLYGVPIHVQQHPLWIMRLSKIPRVHIECSPWSVFIQYTYETQYVFSLSLSLSISLPFSSATVLCSLVKVSQYVCSETVSFPHSQWSVNETYWIHTVLTTLSVFCEMGCHAQLISLLVEHRFD